MHAIQAPVWLPWVALGGVVLMAMMLVALFVLALVFQRWLLALGIVGFVGVGGFVLMGVFTLRMARSSNEVAYIESRSTRPEKDASHRAPTLDEQVTVKREPIELNPIPRPDWVEQTATLRNGSYVTVVRSGLYATPGECQRPWKPPSSPPGRNISMIFSAPTPVALSRSILSICAIMSNAIGTTKPRKPRSEQCIKPLPNSVSIGRRKTICVLGGDKRSRSIDCGAPAASRR